MAKRSDATLPPTVLQAPDDAPRSLASAEVVREYGPFGAGETVHGVSFDGTRVWMAMGSELRALDPVRGELTAALDVICDAGTAFDGTHLYQLGAGRIQKLDPRTGAVLSSIPAPGPHSAGLTWAEGKLWVGQYAERTIVQIDPETGTVLRTLQSDRFVTGVTWAGEELWHGTLEGGVSELRRVDPETGAVTASLALPSGVKVTGLESDGSGHFYCGGGSTGTVRKVKKPAGAAR
jgi:DNA-binding beta-propeller fold protein YncE